MKTIPLSRGKFTIVDDEDFEWLIKDKWYALKPNPRHFYAVSNKYIGNYKSEIKYMHRIIMKPTFGMQVDHINGDTLDNRRINLRIVTHATNRLNHKKFSSGKTSKYSGVIFDKERKKWRATLQARKVVFNLGRFDSEIAAAIAYNNAAIKIAPGYIRLNKIVGHQLLSNA